MDNLAGDLHNASKSTSMNDASSNNTGKIELIVIVGPTASGKSAVAIELAKLVGGEIVSADSMQVYRGMDIGTAKITHEEMQGIKHYLIDAVNPNEQFSAAEYQTKARAAIEKIAHTGKVPILVGGTGLYVRAAIDKLEFPKGTISSNIRSAIEKRAEIEGKDVLYRELVEKDPAAAGIVHPNNLRRIVRALEVIETEGRPFSEFHTEWSNRSSIYDAKMFGLDMDRTVLKERIDKRVDDMIALGLVDEVKHMMKYGFEGFLTSIQAIGYKEIIEFLNGNMTLDEAIDTIKSRTRQYAKRQLTWFRADRRIKWVEIDNKTPVQIADEITSLL